jgi:hypothetical protein
MKKGQILLAAIATLVLLVFFFSRVTLIKVSRETQNDGEIRIFISDSTKIQEDCGAVRYVSRETKNIDGEYGPELAVRLLLNDYMPELKQYYRGLGFAKAGVVSINFTRSALQYLNGLPVCSNHINLL